MVWWRSYLTMIEWDVVAEVPAVDEFVSPRGEGSGQLEKAQKKKRKSSEEEEEDLNSYAKSRGYPPRGPRSPQNPVFGISTSLEGRMGAAILQCMPTHRMYSRRTVPWPSTWRARR